MTASRDSIQIGLAHRMLSNTGVNARFERTKRAGVVILLFAGYGCMSASALAQTAERPMWEYGDTWVFRQHTTPPPSDSQWSRKVVDTMSNGRSLVETEAGKYLRFDNEGNSLDGRGPEYSWRRFKFPMSVGMSWSHDYKIAGATWEGTVQSVWHVRAIEKITVPAGTFDCFRVEGEAPRNYVAAGARMAYTRGYTRTTYWYCPAVKWAAKWEIEDVDYVTAPRVVTVSELVSFEQKH